MKLKFLKDISTGVDNKTYSSKRVAGWISLASFIIFSSLEKPEYVIYANLMLVTALFGLSSIDNSTFIKSKPVEPPNEV